MSMNGPNHLSNIEINLLLVKDNKQEIINRLVESHKSANRALESSYELLSSISKNIKAEKHLRNKAYTWIEKCHKGKW